MATEVGVAYVSILPSLKGFSRRLAADLKRELAGEDPIDVPFKPKPLPIPKESLPKVPNLPVSLDPLTADFQASLQRDLKALTRQINAEIPLTADADGFRAEISAEISAIEQRLKAEIPTEPAGRREYERELRRIVEDVQSRVKAHIEVDRNNFPELRDVGTDAGRTVSGGFTSALSSGMAAVPAGIANPVIIGVGLAIGALLLIPAAVLTVATALTGLGLGFLGLGVYALRGNKEVQTAFADMKTRIGKVFSDVAQPLIKPLVESADIIAGAFEDIKPQLEDLFIALAPLIKPMAQAFADFTKNVMPGLVDAIIASRPFIEELIRELPELGKILRDFLGMLAESGPEAILLFRFALTTLGIAIKLLGGLLYGLSLIFGTFVDAVTWAVNKFIQFQDVVVDGFDLSIITGKFEGFVNDNLAKIGGFVLSTGNKLAQLPVDFYNWITNAANTGTQALSGGVDRLTGIASSIPGRLYNAAYNVISNMRSLLSDAGRAAGRALADGIDYLSNLARSIPDRVARGLGDVGSLLYNAGRSIIQSLINGIQSKVKDLASTMSNIAGKVKGFLPFSPAKEGPLSGHGNPYYSGLSIGRLWAAGIEHEQGNVAAAAARLAASAAQWVAPTPAFAGVPSSADSSMAPATAPTSDNAVSGGTFRLVDGAGRVLALLVREGERDLGRR